MASAPRPGRTSRPRHSMRETSGQFAKVTPARPAPSRHHGAVQSTYDAAQVTKTTGFTPHRASAHGDDRPITPN